jgi:hypothetical protein
VHSEVIFAVLPIKGMSDIKSDRTDRREVLEAHTSAGPHIREPKVFVTEPHGADVKEEVSAE